MFQQSPEPFILIINFLVKEITRQRRVTMHHESVLCIELLLNKLAISTLES